MMTTVGAMFLLAVILGISRLCLGWHIKNVHIKLSDQKLVAGVAMLAVALATQLPPRMVEVLPIPPEERKKQVTPPFGIVAMDAGIPDGHVSGRMLADSPTRFAGQNVVSIGCGDDNAWDSPCPEKKQE